VVFHPPMQISAATNNLPMILDPRPDPFYWRAFNVLLRLLGIGATFAGTVVTVVFGLGIPAPPGMERQTSWGALVPGVLLLFLGLGFLMLPSYRPDRGDTGPVVSLLRPQRGRGWWTGEPRP
jgi:hypothetical protein